MGRDGITFAEIDRPDVDLRVGPTELLAVVVEADEQLASARSTSERAIWAVVSIVARACLVRPPELDDRSLDALGGWLKANSVSSVALWYSLHMLFPQAIADLAESILRVRPDAVVVVAQAASMAPDDIRARCELRLATDPRASVREHYFALLGQHRRLLPPGSIPTKDFAPDVLAEVLRAGITDAVPAVRERAIAVAIGMNVVRVVRDQVLGCLANEHEGVRQYAIVALGTLDDAGSLARLVATLGSGTKAETTSAIWALARRPDGLASVLPLATDSRDWVRGELLGALAQVAAPMTDAQLAALTQGLHDEQLARVVERHLERTRRGGPEYGFEGGVFVVRTSGDGKSAPPGERV